MPEYMKRLSALWKRVLAVLENPDLLIQQEPKSPEMTETAMRVVNAMVRRDHLRQSIEDLERLQKEIEDAEGASDEIQRLHLQLADYKDLLSAARESLNEALQEVEDSKAALMKEREAAAALLVKKKFFF